MGNNVTCKIVGIGSIIIKMYDGIVRTTIDVSSSYQWEFLIMLVTNLRFKVEL